MRIPDDVFAVFLVCDSERHPKTQAVTNFVRVVDPESGESRWDEWYPGKRRDGGDSAVTLVDNARPPTEMLHQFDPEFWSRARPVYEPFCRKCRHPFQWRAEKLFAVLDQAFEEYNAAHGDTGVLPLSLQSVAASIRSLPLA